MTGGVVREAEQLLCQVIQVYRGEGGETPPMDVAAQQAQEVIESQPQEVLAAALIAVIGGHRQPRETVLAWALHAAHQTHLQARASGDVAGSIQALRLVEKLSETLPTAEDMATEVGLAWDG
jgi:hypothetical protein